MRKYIIFHCSREDYSKEDRWIVASNTGPYYRGVAECLDLSTATIVQTALEFMDDSQASKKEAPSDDEPRLRRHLPKATGNPEAYHGPYPDSGEVGSK